MSVRFSKVSDGSLYFKKELEVPSAPAGGLRNPFEPWGFDEPINIDWWHTYYGPYPPPPIRKTKICGLCYDKINTGDYSPRNKVCRLLLSSTTSIRAINGSFFSSSTFPYGYVMCEHGNNGNNAYYITGYRDFWYNQYE